MSKLFNVGQCYYSRYSYANSSQTIESYLRISDVDAWTPDGPGVSTIKITFSCNNGVNYCDVTTCTRDEITFSTILNQEKAIDITEDQFRRTFRKAMLILNSAAEV